ETPPPNMKPLLLVALLGLLASAFAAPGSQKVKWCVKSDQELRKCLDLAAADPAFSCVKKENTLECIIAIKAGEQMPLLWTVGTFTLLA
ncbi:hypothetical protein, partial [Acinetobacter baumannii]|uniref:hypothetical protein n=1 Tax=Acinetobacter baumannii TaxID=470 RepID=UPI0011137C4F